MVRYDRYVYDHDVIAAILELCDVVHVGFQDKDNAYVVPMNYGYEVTKDKLLIYVHSSKEGYKQKLIARNPRVCLSFAAWINYPDRPYKGQYHDFRSVMAFGILRKLDLASDTEACKNAMQAIFKKTRRVGCKNPKGVGAIDLFVIECSWDDVSGKAECPVRTPADVPMADPYHLPEDLTPYDNSDLLVTRENKVKNRSFLGYLDPED